MKRIAMIKADDKEDGKEIYFEMNERLAYNRTIETGNSEFLLFSHLLLTAKSYKGFNWFYKKNIGGEMVNMLVGSSDKETLIEKDGFLQFY